MKWDGTVAPSVDGSLSGFQVGQDLLGWKSIAGHFDRVGVFVSHARMDGDVEGQALGWDDLSVGNVGARSTALGAYWTHGGPQGWYLDSVLMGTWSTGDASSDSGESIDIDGTAVTASLEGGYPIPLTQQGTVEPQAQLIWQHLSLDRQADRFATISFHTDDALTGRLGSRLRGDFPTAIGPVQLYLKANLWHNFSAEETLRFNEDSIVTDLRGTSLELGGGLVASLSPDLSLFATAGYRINLDEEKTRILMGNLGVSVSWSACELETNLWIPVPEHLIQVIIQHASAGLKEQMRDFLGPLHLLPLDEALAHDLVNRRLFEGRADGIALAVAFAEAWNELTVVANLGVELGDTAKQLACSRRAPAVDIKALSTDSTLPCHRQCFTLSSDSLISVPSVSSSAVIVLVCCFSTVTRMAT